MIELIVAAVIGVVVGGGVVRLVMQRSISNLRELKNNCCHNYYATHCALTALRANCFITNEKGHRVRYTAASVAARVKAEKPAGVA